MEEPGQRYPSPAAPACLHVVVALLVSKASRPQATTILSCTCCLWWCRLCLCAWPWPRLTPSHPSIQSQGNPSPLLAYVDTSRARKPAPPSLLAGQQQPWRPPEDQRGLVSFPFSSLSPWCWRWARWAPWPPRAPRSRPPSSHHQPRLLHSWAGQGPWAAARPCAPRGHVERYVPTALETHAPVSQPIPLHPTTHPLYD